MIHTPSLNGARVAFVITRMIIGGAQATVLETAQRLKQRGVDCEILTGPETGPEGHLFHEVDAAGVPLVISKDLVREIHPIKDLKAVFSLWRLFRQRRYQIVHTNSSKAGVVGRVAARLAGVPVVIHWVHGFAFNAYQSRFERRLYLLVEQLCGALADHLVVVSKPVLRRTLRHRIAGPERVSLVYSGIELEKYRLDLDKGELRTRIGLPADATVIGSVARLVEGKGHHDLLRAFAEVRQQHGNTCLVLVGDGPLRAELESLARELNVESGVHFLGLRRDVPSLMQAFDIFVLASLWEGMGRVLLEAMASGNAVIATRVDGIVDLIQDGVNGLLVDPRSPRSLSAALTRLVTEPQLRRKLANRGNAFVGDEYSIDSTADAVLTLYESLLERSARGGSKGQACSIDGQNEARTDA